MFKAPRSMWLFIVFILATALISIPIGVIIGTSSVGVGQLTDKQNAFVDGVAQGAEYMVDYQEWNALPEKDKVKGDFRAFPETRCAARFYPQDPIGMAGCTQGINRPKDGKYSIPEVPH